MAEKLGALFVGLLAVVAMLLTWAQVIPSEQVEAVESSYSTAYIQHFFDQYRVIDIHISLPAAEFADMLENPTKEEYKVASAVVNGVKVENVGFRVKGNSSLSMVANSNSKRFSFKLDIDQYITGQTLAGLTKLNLNNSISDPSYMREYLSYSLLNQAGVPTPGFSYANLYVNGQLIGLYLAVEGLEEPFLERYYGKGYGTLYKPEGLGSDLVYTDNNIESYSGIDPVTKQSRAAAGALLRMLKALNEGQDLGKYLDIEGILRYFAVNTVLVNMDSYLSNMKHNYYLYEEDGVFTILPWDYNMSFGGFNMGGGNAIGLYIDQPLSGTTLDQRPLIGKLLESAEYKELYHQYIAEFITSTFTPEKMHKEIERVAGLIRPHLEKDQTKFYSMEQFEQAIQEGSTVQDNSGAEEPTTGQGRAPGGGRMLQGGSAIGLAKFVRERVENVAKQLQGELPSVGDTTAQTQRGEPGNIRGQAGRGAWGERPEGAPGQMQGGVGIPQKMPGMEIPQGMPEGMQRPAGAELLQNQQMRPDRDRANFGEERVFQQVDKSKQLYLVGVSLVGLFVVTLLVLRKKTRYSV